jgi:hypothetical protein
MATPALIYAKPCGASFKLLFENVIAARLIKLCRQGPPSGEPKGRMRMRRGDSHCTLRREP